MSLTCPKCTQTCALQVRDLKGVAVKVCGGCRGILMKRDDLDALVTAVGRKAKELGRTGSLPENYFERLQQTAKFVGRSSSLECPCCRYNMYEIENQGIVLDFCLNCQATWLDDGELNTTLKVARERGFIDLTPADVSDNETANLICYMLSCVTEKSSKDRHDA